MDQQIRHSRAFVWRRALNWLPLGITYAFVYMGRYSINVAKNPIMERFSLDKAHYGHVMGTGLAAYAIATALNGPLSDRLGGRKSMLIGTFGAAVMNLLIGLRIAFGGDQHLVLSLTLLHAVNMYFQSFCALALVKVNAPWFHVRERGVFQGVFGVLISSGYLVGFYGGGAIARNYALQFVFLVPAVLITIWGIVDYFQLKNRPSEAGYPDFNTGDATADDHDRDQPVTFAWVLKRVLRNRVIMTLALAELCTGYLRYSLVNWWDRYLKEVHHVETGAAVFNIASWGLTIGGIIGGFAIGILSDRMFHSRRPPVAAIFYVAQIPLMFWLVHSGTPQLAAILVGVNCIFVFGIHGLLSGTSSMDFGGAKGASTVTGIFNGVHYVGSYLTGWTLGWFLDKVGWGGWAWATVPFSIIGFIAMMSVWNESPLKKQRQRAPAKATA